MSTQMALVTGTSMAVAQAKAAGRSAQGFGAEMQNALASAAAGTPLPQDEAAGQAGAVPEGTMGEGQLEGFAGINDLLAALGIASPIAALPMAASPTADLARAAGQPETSGVQPFLQGTIAHPALSGAAQNPSGVPAEARTQGPALAVPGSSAYGTALGVSAPPAPAVAAAAAAETGSPTAALSPPGARHVGMQGSHADSTDAAIPAPVTGASAAGTTAAQAQQGSDATPGTASAAPLGDGLQDVASAQLVAVPAGQQPAATVPVPAAPGSSPAPAASPPLNTQLQGPLFSLATAKPGEHTMTVSVTPDNLGPVTVRAQIGADGVLVELFAPNDAGREALRAILQDLKRDLASAGLGADLDLSSQNQPDEPEEDGPGRQGSTANQEGTTGRQLAGPGHHAGPYLRLDGSQTGLDVLA